MAADWLTYLLLSLSVHNLKLASYAFLAGYLIVKGAYKLGIVDEHIIDQDKGRKGTLGVQTILFILGLIALFVLHSQMNYPRMQALVFRMPEIMYMLIIASLVIFVYVADFLKNLVQAYESKESGVQRFLHVIIDAVNLVYGLSFAFFGIPVLSYFVLEALTP